MSKDRRDHGPPPADDFDQITPISRRESARAGQPDQAGSGRGWPAYLLGGSLLLLLVVIGVGVFYYLPTGPGSRPPAAQSPTPAPPKAAAEPQPPKPAAPSREKPSAPAAQPPAPPASGTHQAAGESSPPSGGQQPPSQAKQQAQEALGKFLDRKDALEAKAVKQWGKEVFAQALAKADAGDTAMVDKDYQAAREAYQAGLEQLKGLSGQADKALRAALAAGQQALEEEDSATALEQFQLAQAIDGDNQAAVRGLKRARSLDEVLALYQSALDHEQQGDLKKAVTELEKAAARDPAFDKAPRALKRIRQAIVERNFKQAMSRGFAALDDKDFGKARAAFQQAGKLKPDAPGPDDALAQVKAAIQAQQIAAHRHQAQQEAQNEDWQAAAEAYDAALKLDPNLAFARQGKAHAQRRAKLDKRLQYQLDHPDRLSSDEVYQESRGILQQAQAVQAPGSRLQEQIGQLTQALKRARTPVTVRLVSDDHTRVAVYKVGRLGHFESRELTLKPGTYTAVGTRSGYRDVRRRFTLVAGKQPDPVTIRCTEEI